MQKKPAILIGVLLILAIGTGVVIYKTAFSSTPKKVIEEPIQETLPPADASIQVDLIKSTAKANTVILSVKGMAGKMKMVAYELTYESQGVIQGVTSKPVDVSGQDSFTRDDIYLGTCSRNVCRPHPGVSKVSVVLEFTDSSGQKSQFSRDYPL